MKRVGEHIGSIRLTEHLGTGGMGDVFVGYDEKLGREVAVKAIRPECLSEEIRGRLVREAQILSSLDHESICRIYGLHEEEGEAFLVLELIRGKTLRELLETGLSFRQKLKFSERIAVALEAAHRQGVVHRDVKLENVMLRQDGVIKVVDFGVARSEGERPVAASEDPPAGGTKIGAPEADVRPRKATGAPHDSSFTEVGEAVGTLSTMSPEQARGEEVSSATDLYSLGLLLQELFTGQAPYPAGLSDDVLRLRAREGDTLPVRDVDASVTALIEDLKSPEPGRRPTAAQVVERLAAIRARGRRRLRWGAAAVLLLLTLGGLVKYASDLRRERNAAIEARREAERHSREAEQVVDFLVDLFRASDPTSARGHDPRASEILDRGADAIEASLEGQPLVQARLMEVIGEVSRMLGRMERAEGLLRDARELRLRHQGPGHLDVAGAEAELGDLLRLLGRFDEAEQLLESSLTVRRSDLGEASPAVSESLNELGAVSLARGDFERAAECFERVIAARHGDPTGAEMVTAARNNLAVAYVQLGRLEAASEEHRAVLAARRQLLGADHPEVGTSLNNLAVVSYLQGDLGRAESLMQEALDIWRQAFGAEHPQVATALSNLGEIAVERNQLDVAQGRFEKALEAWREALGPDHPDLAYALHGLGHVARGRGEVDAARASYRRALEIREAALAPGHPETEQVREDLLALGEGGAVSRP